MGARRVTCTAPYVLAPVGCRVAQGGHEGGLENVVAGLSAAGAGGTCVAEFGGRGVGVLSRSTAADPAVGRRDRIMPPSRREDASGTIHNISGSAAGWHPWNAAAQPTPHGPAASPPPPPCPPAPPHRSTASCSMSCSAPRPLVRVAAAPPSSTMGDSAIWAFFTAVTVLVMPGPAVTHATPGMPVSRATASAANTAVASCRTSMMRRPAALAATMMGDTCPPISVNRYGMPAVPGGGAGGGGGWTAVSCAGSELAGGPRTMRPQHRGDELAAVVVGDRNGEALARPRVKRGPERRRAHGAGHDELCRSGSRQRHRNRRRRLRSQVRHAGCLQAFAQCR
jgi:hypothetical protein